LILTWVPPCRLVKYPEPASGAETARVQGAGKNLLYQQKSVIEAARASGWISDRFDSFITNKTAGSAPLNTPESIQFIVQTPKDDQLPFFAMSLTQRNTETHQQDADWEGIVFIRPNSLWDKSIEPMLGLETFPHDYSDPLVPDFMVLPVCHLSYEVQQILAEFGGMETKLGALTEGLTAKSAADLKEVKIGLFALRDKKDILLRRWEFASELAGNLLEFFGIIERRYSSEDETVTYSPTLTARVTSQQTILKSARHDLNSISSRIESQQNFVSQNNP
jgi:hypothetical protein